jgi:cell division control protein 7
LTYLTKLDLIGIKRYMFTLLGAVEHLADLGVMHRDIKPTNFLYDTDTHTGLLIDFGLSELERDTKGQPKKHGDND